MRQCEVIGLKIGHSTRSHRASEKIEELDNQPEEQGDWRTDNKDRDRHGHSHQQQQHDVLNEGAERFQRTSRDDRAPTVSARPTVTPFARVIRPVATSSCAVVMALWLPSTRGVHPRISCAARRPAKTVNSNALNSEGRGTTRPLLSHLSIAIVLAAVILAIYRTEYFGDRWRRCAPLH